MKIIKSLILLSLCFLCMSCEKDVNLDYLIGEWNYYSKDSRVIVDSGTDMEFVDGENVLVKFWDMLGGQGWEKTYKYKTDGVYLDIDGDTRYKIILLKKDDMTLYSIKYDNYSYYRRIKE